MPTARVSTSTTFLQCWKKGPCHPPHPCCSPPPSCLLLLSLPGSHSLLLYFSATRVEFSESPHAQPRPAGTAPGAPQLSTRHLALSPRSGRRQPTYLASFSSASCSRGARRGCACAASPERPAWADIHICTGRRWPASRHGAGRGGSLCPPTLCIRARSQWS